MSLFGEIDYDEVNTFLDQIQNDSDILMMSDIDKSKTIEYYQKAIEKEFACDEQLCKHAEEW